MKLTVYRAENPNTILVEITAAGSKILLDGGVSLEENEVLLLPKLQAQYSLSEVDAVFLAHYNTDHVTMARGLLSDVPTYAGKLSAKMATAAESYKAKKPFPFAGYYEHGVPITVGALTVTPFLVDDAFHEGYLLLIEGEGKRILYTGDYRANGRKRFEEMLAGMPEKCDLLLCEGGALTADDMNPITERDLEERAANLISGKKGPVFALCSAVDFDRVTTLFHAAKRNKRVFLEDLYLSEISSATGKAMPNPMGWTGVRAYLTTGYKAEHFRYKRFTELPRMSKAEIAAQKFVMCIRPSMKKYLKTLSQEVHFHGGLLLNALPAERIQNPAVTEFLTFAVEKGLTVTPLRESGHAGAMAVKALIERTHPAKILPLAREDTAWFAQNYPQAKIVGEAVLEL